MIRSTPISSTQAKAAKETLASTALKVAAKISDPSMYLGDLQMVHRPIFYDKIEDAPAFCSCNAERGQHC
ncbi:hypothetical protein [Agrobacterium rubi]|uniref:Uncharacterized protein n=1 Tax=Agrobacterium rubi TaxID=28099 RepID=A0AAE7R8P7_9HYPH|nr:hypothetical protein [Agrobacterium rubi]NTE89776.1 hypothetical protein [Agrobacterium rubi]NTF05374.1 hypothetical protein [Agrobacterium rubi]NTF39818.1 hypothetical protein [Agrobacterium rubi]QTG03346.1 hypothetical protein G6M88_23080 [Agrobacterium rubi]